MPDISEYFMQLFDAAPTEQNTVPDLTLTAPLALDLNRDSIPPDVQAQILTRRQVSMFWNIHVR